MSAFADLAGLLAADGSATLRLPSEAVAKATVTLVRDGLADLGIAVSVTRAANVLMIAPAVRAPQPAHPAPDAFAWITAADPVAAIRSAATAA